jgi:hypothetical protein
MSRPALASWNCILHDNLCGAATRAVVLVDADHLARRRLAHKVVPWVMEPERKRMELLTAQKEFRDGQSTHSLIEVKSKSPPMKQRQEKLPNECLK